MSRSDKTTSRRDFLRVTAASSMMIPLLSPSGRSIAAEFQGKNERPRLALIGAGGQGSGDARWASNFGDFVAVCDVDKNNAERARDDRQIGKGKADAYEEYRKVLDRKDVDAVIIGTPDHWHSKILIDAMKAGKDAYCEKPLTLTIDEGKLIGKVARETKQVVQVGTQQRSDHGRRLPDGGRPGAGGADRQDSQDHGRHRRRPVGRPVREGSPAGRPQLGHVARPGPEGRLHQAALP